MGRGTPRLSGCQTQGTLQHAPKSVRGPPSHHASQHRPTAAKAVWASPEPAHCWQPHQEHPVSRVHLPELGPWAPQVLQDWPRPRCSGRGSPADRAVLCSDKVCLWKAMFSVHQTLEEVLKELHGKLWDQHKNIFSRQQKSCLAFLAVSHQEKPTCQWEARAVPGEPCKLCPGSLLLSCRCWPLMMS